MSGTHELLAEEVIDNASDPAMSPNLVFKRGFGGVDKADLVTGALIFETNKRFELAIAELGAPLLHCSLSGEGSAIWRWKLCLEEHFSLMRLLATNRGGEFNAALLLFIEPRALVVTLAYSKVERVERCARDLRRFFGRNFFAKRRNVNVNVDALGRFAGVGGRGVIVRR